MTTLTIVPGKLDLEFYGGDDVHFTLKFKREVTPATDPVTYEYFLPDGALSAMIRKEPGCDTAYSCEIATDETDPVNPFAVVTVPSEVTAALVIDQPMTSRYVKEELITAPMFVGSWDLQSNSGPGEIRTHVFGSVTAIGEVTR